MAEDDTDTGDPPALAFRLDVGRGEDAAEQDDPVTRPVRDRSRAHQVAALTRTVAGLEDRFDAMRRRLEEARDTLDDIGEEARRRQ